MIARTTRITLEVLAGIIAVLVLLVGVSLWRLSTGPVDLDFITPKIEAALSDPDGGISVEIGATQLTWGGWRRTIDLHTRNVTVRDREGVTVAALPDIVVRLSLRALAQATVAPTRVEVIGAHISLVREVDGSFQFAGGVEAKTTPDEAELSQLLPTVLRQLMSEPTAGQPLSFLRAVRIVGGQISIDDRKLGRAWEAPYANIELRRDSVGLAGDMDLTMTLGAAEAQVDGGFVYDKLSEKLNLTAEFADLQPEAVISVAPQLERFVGMTVPLDGAVSGSLSVSGAFDWLRFEVSGGAGELMLPDLLPEALPVMAVEVKGWVRGPERRIDLDALTLTLGTPGAPGPEISASGTLTSGAPDFAGDLEIEGEVTAAKVPMAELGHYWPPGVGGNGRPWVLKNIPKGAVDKAVLKAAFHVPDGDFGAVEIRRLGGTLDFRDLDVHFLRPMPPVTKVSGNGTFDHQGLVLRPKEGRLGELRLKPTTVTISGLDTGKDLMNVDLAAAAPLRATLEILDHDRLGLIRRLGIDPSKTDGDMAVQAKIGFPMLAALTFDGVKVSAQAKLAQVTVRKFLLDRDATKGDLALSLDKSGMRVTGPLEFAGVPMEIDWREAFTAKAPYRTMLEARVARFDEDGRRKLGVDLAPYLSGPLAASIAYKAARDGHATVQAAVDLEDARLAIEPLLWAKAPGVAGKADFTLVLDKQTPVALKGIDIAAGTLVARGRGKFDGLDGKLGSLFLEELTFDRTELSVVTVDLSGDGFDVEIGSGVLDAAPFLNGDAEAKDEPGKKAPDKSKDGPEAPHAPVEDRLPFRLSARNLDAVHFTPERYLEAVTLNLERVRRGWRRVGLDGRVPRALWYAERPEGMKPPETSGEPADKTLRIDYRPAQDGGHALLVTSNDMGAVLRALDILDTIDGGRMEIVGRSSGPMPGHVLEARIEAKDYVLIEAPTLAKLLSVASLTGIVNRLGGGGIEYKRLVGEFTVENGLFKTDLIRAYGPELGLTAKGEMNFNELTADLRGTVVPAYTVNQILGEIPVLGFLLTGGKGEGFLAVTYRMTGDLRDPEFGVNPLSALAPGFLRGLFDGGGDGSEQDRPRALPERESP
jgi:hypothetical protein